MGALVSHLAPPLHAWPGQGGGGHGSLEASIPIPHRRPGGGIASCITFPTPSTCRSSWSYASGHTGVPGLPGLPVSDGSGPRAPFQSGHRVRMRHSSATTRRRLGNSTRLLPWGQGRGGPVPPGDNHGEVHSRPDVPESQIQRILSRGSQRFCGNKG